MSTRLDPVVPPALARALEAPDAAEAVQDRGAFVVNLLTRDQRALSARFARRGVDHFEGLPTSLTDEGLPALAGCAGRAECHVEAVHPGGDHIIVVGRVHACRTNPGSPLIFYRGRYHRLGSAGHDGVLAAG